MTSHNTNPFHIDDVMIAKALRDGMAVSNDKAVCHPLIADGKTIGLIYADMAARGEEWFTAGHMHVLPAMAGAAAVALEHARYVSWLEGENRRLNGVINVEHGMIGQSDR